jgi:hypothetical protein
MAGGGAAGGEITPTVGGKSANSEETPDPPPPQPETATALASAASKLARLRYFKALSAPPVPGPKFDLRYPDQIASGISRMRGADAKKQSKFENVLARIVAPTR